MKVLSYIISLIFLWSTGAMAFAPGFLQVACNSESSCSGDYGRSGTSGSTNALGLTHVATRVVLPCSSTSPPTIKAYLTGSSSVTYIKLALYSSNGGEPDSLLYESGIFTVPGDSTQHIYQYTLSSNLSAGTYYIAMRTTEEGNSAMPTYTPASGQARYIVYGEVTSFPSTWPTSTDSDSTAERHFWLSL